MSWSRAAIIFVTMFAALFLIPGCGDDDPVGPGGGDPAVECIDYGDYLHWVGSVETPDDAQGVAVSGSYAYVADYYSGLQVVDITTPASPVIVGSVDTPDRANDVSVSGGYAYVADWASGLQVIDITTPASPVIVGSVAMPDYANGVAIASTGVCVADQDSGLQIAPRQCGDEGDI